MNSNSLSSHSCLIVAGEKSGEEHALSFIDYLKQVDPLLEFWGVGGSELEKKGVELIYHLRDFSSWGYSEVIQKIPFYFQAMSRLEEEVEKRDCRVAILVDFQSFNLKLAEKLHSRGVKVLYYVAPQAWAWKSYRVKKLAQNVTKLFTIIPFEQNWFLERGVHSVQGVPHPVWLTYREQLEQLNVEVKKTPESLLVLPGSRNFEVKELLPRFVETLKKLQRDFPLKAILVKSSNVREGIYADWESHFDQIYWDDDLSLALREADFALAASGTVTLSCALFQVPTVVCYRTSLLNQWIFETFVNYEGVISLANIVHEREIFPEFVQDEVSTFNLSRALKTWLTNPTTYERIRKELGKTCELVGGSQKGTSEAMSEVIRQAYS